MTLSRGFKMEGAAMRGAKMVASAAKRGVNSYHLLKIWMI